MFTFSVSDSFYRFNCQSGISFDSGIHGVTKMLILPYGNRQLTNICERAYKTLDKDLKKVVIYSPTNDDISEHLDLLNDREVIVKTCSEDINPNIIENDTALVILTTLSRGFNYNDARDIDSFTAGNIEENKINKDITFEEFSAFEVLPLLLGYASDKGYSFIRLELANSADFNTNFASTLGYGAWMLYEGSSAGYVKKYYSDTVIDFVKFNLKNNMHIACSECFNFPEVFNQEFKIIISLEKDGFVRGVSGSFKTREKLFKALVKRSFGVAFSDNRFAPVQPDEIDRLKINVVLLENNLMNSVLIES